MRKYMITTAMALAVAATAAEARDIAPGTFMVSGDTNIDISSSEISASGESVETDSTKIDITGAYFFSPNVGAGLLWSNESSEIDDGNTVSEESMNMIGPVIGYNISLNPDSSILLHGAYFFVDGEFDEGAFSADIDGSGFMLGASYNYFINDNVATSVGFRSINADVDLSSGGDTTSADLDETGVSAGLSLFF